MGYRSLFGDSVKIPARPVKGKNIPPGWFGEFYDYVKSLAPRGNGKNFFVNWTDHGWIGSTQPGSASSGGNSSGGSSYEAPFTVVKASDTSVTVLGYNTGAGRTWKNYLGLGNSWVEAAEATVSSITSTGYLYLEITYSTSYTLTFKFSAGETPPTRDNTHGILIVRRIVCTDSVITSIENPVNIVDMGGKIF